MLWWDDSFQREHGCQRPQIGEISWCLINMRVSCFPDVETIACFRTTRTVRIPKKVLSKIKVIGRESIMCQVAKNKEPKHKGWELAPQESIKLNLSQQLFKKMRLKS